MTSRTTVEELIQLLDRNVHFLSGKDQNYKRRLEDWSQRNPKKSIHCYIECFLGLKLVTAKTEVLRLLAWTGEIRRVSFFEKTQLITLASSTAKKAKAKSPAKKTKIITFKKWKEAINSNTLAPVERLVLEFLLRTGKRWADAMRVSGNEIFKRSGYFLVSVKGDKKNDCKITFKVGNAPEKLRELALPDEVFFEQFDTLAKERKDTKIFGEVNKASLRRKLGFTIHSVRSLFAVALTHEGLSPDAICSRVGWGSKLSLQRYLRATGPAIRANPCLEEVLIELEELAED